MVADVTMAHRRSWFDRPEISTSSPSAVTRFAENDVVGREAIPLHAAANTSTESGPEDINAIASAVH